MIELLPVPEPSFLNFLNKTYHTDGKFAFVCVEKKEIKSSLIYDVKKQKGVILNVSTVEEDIFDGLVRACFAALLDMGIHQAEFAPEVDAGMTKKLGFVGENPYLAESLDEILDNCKKCKKNQV